MDTGDTLAAGGIKLSLDDAVAEVDAWISSIDL